MRIRFYSFLFFLLVGACVDRLQYDTPKSEIHAFSVDGFISNERGPYRINVNSSRDIQSEATKTPVSVRQLTISDNTGETEILTEVSKGVYETKSNGIQGKVGRVYSLRVELFDGRAYESLPDTLPPSGKMDSVYYSFTSTVNQNSAEVYGFDILFNSQIGLYTANRFIWNTTATFQSETHPENNINSGCYMLPNGICNFVPICTGLLNLGGYPPNYKRVGPCTCCTCWYDMFNLTPLLSDDLFSTSYTGIKAYHVNLDGWIFMHKVRVEVAQMSLSLPAFRFWKAVRDQKTATGNLFQPISGKIPINFVQLSGGKSPLLGLFFATSVSKKSIYIRSIDVPPLIPIPSVDGLGNISCFDLFPNATNIKPAYWQD